MRFVYSFGDGASDGMAAIGDREERKRILGGKGAGLAEMTAAGLPVPPGFTISCQACLLWQKDGALPAAIDADIAAALALLEKRIGRKLGDASNPLLVSVRSGSPKSMPGMMDTILNLGLNTETVAGLAKLTKNPRFAWDAYRRFIALFGTIVLGLERPQFEERLQGAKKRAGVKSDTELTADVLQKDVVPAYLALVKKETGKEFPQDVQEQLRLARDAVFGSWMNPRATEYRRRFQIPDDLGTAVNVQAMVFGNKGETSATGVGFTRNPATGEHVPYGEFLQNAQGEDVVAGVRTPRPILELAKILPEAAKSLLEITTRLEKHYKWPQDFEFTIEEGRLFMLQTRDAKSTARASLRWAVDLLDAGIIDEETALLRVDPSTIDQVLHPEFEGYARAKAKVLTKGLPAGPGAAAGLVVFQAEHAVKEAREGKRVVLVRAETSPDDIAGMIAAQGILTATGGMTSHAAVVGRQLGKPCVVGAQAVAVDEGAKLFRVGDQVVREGDPISLDGTTGEVLFGELPTTASEVLRSARGELPGEPPQLAKDFQRIVDIADKHARLKVRTNADRPKDAKVARQLGAKGIGLCRTEHMFFEEGRLPIVQRMIFSAPKGREGLVKLAAAKAGGRRANGEVKAIREQYGEAIDAYEQALAELLPMQRKDFLGLFREMDGYPVTIRTLDPPLHEFLPKREELMVAVAQLEAGGKIPASMAKLVEQLVPLKPALGLAKTATKRVLLETVLARVEQLHEFNPMLGHRGCRLGISYPEITAMQARAIFEAAAKCREEGRTLHVEVMIPLVGAVKELAAQKAIVLAVKEEVEKKTGPIPVMVGTMIEVPRGALTADEIAKEAEFFSFGTNDLTQMTFGFSRDDIGKFIHRYVEDKILPGDPFVSIDRPGIGKLMRIAVEGGKSTRPDIKLGICGEHGGDPASIEVCHELGLAYVSCSPLRVPVARLAAAHAAINEKNRK